MRVSPYARVSTWAWTILALLCLLPFLRLAFFAHPYLDDFIFPVMLREKGLWQHTVNMYMTHQGRFSASFITALHPMTWGHVASVKPFVFGFILVFAGSTWYSGAALVRGEAWSTRLAAGSLVVALALLMLPSPTEAFYWILSGLFYMGGTICCLLLLAIVAHLQQTDANKAWWLPAGALAFLAPGFSEMISCFVLVLAGLLLPLILRRRLGFRWVLLLAVAILGSAIAVLAPGNFIRLESMKTQLPLPVAVIKSVPAYAYTLVSWLGNGLLIVITLLVLPALQRLASKAELPLHKLTRIPWFWPLLTLGGLYMSYLFCHLMGGPPPSRARNVLFVLFVVGWFMSVAGGLSYWLRSGRTLMPPLPRYARAALAALLLLLITTDHNYKLQRAKVGQPGNAVAQAYKDWLSGDAARYDEDEEERYALIRRTPGEAVALPKLSVQPVTLVWWDISINAELWGNKAYAAYFNKKSIYVQP